MPYAGHRLLGVQQSYSYDRHLHAQMATAGARIVRTTLDLASRQQTLIDQLDPIVADHHKRGVQLLICVTYTPPDLGRYHQVPTSSAARAAWVDRARFFVARYAGRVAWWEPWNEPNHGPMNEGANPLNYLGLLRAFHAMVTITDPAALVCTGGTAPRTTITTGPPGQQGYKPPDWYLALYQQSHGALPAHGVGHHPYPPGRNLASIDKEWNPVVWDTNRIHEIVAWCQASVGAPDLPIVGTETGRRTGLCATCIPDTDQGRHIFDLVGTWWSMPFTGPLILLPFQDDPAGSDDTLRHAGLLRADGTGKSGLSMFTQLARAA